MTQLCCACRTWREYCVVVCVCACLRATWLKRRQNASIALLFCKYVTLHATTRARWRSSRSKAAHRTRRGRWPR
jgi:hypothetical protein